MNEWLHYTSHQDSLFLAPNNSKFSPEISRCRILIGISRSFRYKQITNFQFQSVSNCVGYCPKYCNNLYETAVFRFPSVLTCVLMASSYFELFHRLHQISNRICYFLLTALLLQTHSRIQKQLQLVKKI